MPLYARNPFHDSRITPEAIAKLTGRIRSVTKHYCTLCDPFTASIFGENEAILVDLDTVAHVDELDYEYFVLAIDCDQLAAAVARRLRDTGKKYFAPGGATARYYHLSRDVRDLLFEEHDNDRRDGITHFNDPDFCNIAQAVDLTRDVPGAYVEVGVYNGASARFALRYMQKRSISRDCYFFDVFDGFTYDQALSSADAVWAGTHRSEGRDIVAGRLAPFAPPGRRFVIERRNIVDEPLPETITGIALANLDVDIYEGIAAGLRKLADRMVPGGILIAEDPGHTPHLVGARLALDEFLQGDGRFTPIVMESGQTLLLRK